MSEESHTSEEMEVESRPRLMYAKKCKKFSMDDNDYYGYIYDEGKTYGELYDEMIEAEQSDDFLCWLGGDVDYCRLRGYIERI